MSKNILIGISGGIAVYKVCTLVRLLKKHDYNVKIIMTEHATKFVAPLTFESLSGEDVVVDMFDAYNKLHIGHITLAKQADAVVICPATANIISKMACGIADDMLSTTVLAATCPMLVCPAMNTNMYNNVATQQNIDTLKKRGVHIVESNSGELACGDVGKGRMAEPQQIFDAIQSLLATKQDLSGKKVVVTVGATAEKLDDVRVITNNSSGKMGFAICSEALARGASVTAIVARHTAQIPEGINVVNVDSTQEMYDAVMHQKDNTDIFVMAAAPADYRPKQKAASKLKADSVTLELVKNIDIAAQVGKTKGNKILVTFAAETDNGMDNARKKLKSKNADFVVLNNVKDGKVFGSDYNSITIVDKKDTQEYQQLPKTQVAKIIIDKAVSLL